MEDDKNFAENFENLPEFEPSDFSTKYLSEEVKEVFGCEFPGIDLFQTARPVIGIPREIISDIIHKGNSIRLIAMPFADGRGMADAFDANLEMIHWDVEDIIDCFAGIFIGKNINITATDIAEFSAHLDEVLPKHVEPFWGFYKQDELPESLGQVIIVATKKRENEPLHNTNLPF